MICAHLRYLRFFRLTPADPLHPAHRPSAPLPPARYGRGAVDPSNCMWYTHMRIVKPMPRDRSTTRRLLIRRFLSEQEISSQGALADLLEQSGHQVTQSTISRDLADLGATKTDEGTEHERYVLRSEALPVDEHTSRLRRALEDYLLGAIPSGNMLVLKVRAATAGAVAAAVDAIPLDGVIGTIAGDDTVLLIADSPRGGSVVAEKIMEILEA